MNLTVKQLLIIGCACVVAYNFAGPAGLGILALLMLMRTKHD